MKFVNITPYIFTMSIIKFLRKILTIHYTKIDRYIPYYKKTEFRHTVLKATHHILNSMSSHPIQNYVIS